MYVISELCCIIDEDKKTLLTLGHGRWKELPTISVFLLNSHDSNSALLPKCKTLKVLKTSYTTKYNNNVTDF